jgi:hypothetical protein
VAAVLDWEFAISATALADENVKHFTIIGGIIDDHK